MSPRRVARPWSYGGVDFEPEDRVFFMFGSANRDEACFPDPDRFDITRDTAKSIAFGAGPHYCAGAFASRAMVADVALPGLFKRLEGSAARSIRAGADRRLGVSRTAESAGDLGRRDALCTAEFKPSPNPLLQNAPQIIFGVRTWPTKRRSGKDDRDRKARAASRADPDRRVIPAAPDWKVRVASPARKASRDPKVRAASRARKASLVRRASAARRESLVHRARPGEAGPQGKPGVQGPAGPRGEPGPPGELPSIERVMPWLHLIFDAWEDHRQMRAREAAERQVAALAAEEQAAVERAERAAMAAAELEFLSEDPHDDHDGDHKKKKKRHKDKK